MLKGETTLTPTRALAVSQAVWFPTILRRDLDTTAKKTVTVF